VHNVEGTVTKELISVLSRFPTEFSTGVLKSTKATQLLRERFGGRVVVLGVTETFTGENERDHEDLISLQRAQETSDIRFADVRGLYPATSSSNFWSMSKLE